MTLPPLLIAAENGDLLFYSGVRRRDACFAAIRTACLSLIHISEPTRP